MLVKSAGESDAPPSSDVDPGVSVLAAPMLPLITIDAVSMRICAALIATIPVGDD